MLSVKKAMKIVRKGERNVHWANTAYKVNLYKMSNGEDQFLIDCENGSSCGLTEAYEDLLFIGEWITQKIAVHEIGDVDLIIELQQSETGPQIIINMRDRKNNNWNQKPVARLHRYGKKGKLIVDIV